MTSQRLRSTHGTSRRSSLRPPYRPAALHHDAESGEEHYLVCYPAAVEIVAAILAGYDLQGDDAIDATRALRAALHGFVTLETTFTHPADIDRSFDRLVQGLTTALDDWANQPSRTQALHHQPITPLTDGCRVSFCT